MCSTIGFDQESDHRYLAVDTAHLSLKSALHMLFHLLGRYHEHQRPDKDRHIRVVEGNIIQGTYTVYAFVNAGFLVYMHIISTCVYKKKEKN